MNEIMLELHNRQAIACANELSLMAPEPLAECRRCEGWGVVLGTNVPDDHWGDQCDCGRKLSLVDLDKTGLLAAHECARARQGA